ncbi:MULTISPECIES: tetronasin resistance protein [unclassified Enterococcus]|uniref:ABC transporter permease n=1 Tax=unclassified Enterococcus TaxID=2608891 RepID=UPI0013ED1838|nr:MULTISPECIES: tetronasin resistance protein [unclassified Enterococcus]
MNERFSHWTLLLFQNLSRDWKKIFVWVFGTALFAGGFVPAFEEVTSGNGLIGLYETLQNPAMIAMVGSTPVSSADQYTLGAMYAQEMLLFCGVFAAVLSILQVISQTRKKEDLGLIELVRSYSVGRQANSLAVLIETIVINLVLAGVISGLMIVFQVETITVEGALLFGLSVGSAGVFGGMIALFFAQLMPNASSATGASLAFLGLMYLVRAGTDIGAEAFSMANPLGWIYLTYPFTENNWLPLLYLVSVALIGSAAAFFLEEHRDLNTGYLREREGRASTKRSLLSIRGLLLYLNRGMILSWLAAFAVLGAAYGSIYGNMQTFLESNELMKQMFIKSGISLEKNFTSTILVVLACLAAILPIAVVHKTFAEEKHGRMAQLFSTKVSRNQLYWSTMLIAAGAAILAIFVSAGSLGLAALSVMDESTTMDLPMFLGSGFNLLPSILFFGSLSGFLFGWIPKAGKIVYVYLGYSFAINYFGNLLDLPEWFTKTAIQSWVPRLPVDSFEWPVFLTILFLSVLLAVLGAVGYRHRDLIEEN